jgi:hypothetical protein
MELASSMCSTCSIKSKAHNKSYQLIHWLGWDRKFRAILCHLVFATGMKTFLVQTLCEGCIRF